MYLSKKATRLVDATHAGMTKDPAALNSLVELARYVSKLEQRLSKLQQTQQPKRTRSTYRAVAANATSDLMQALEYVLNNERASRDAVASHVDRTVVAGRHIVDALEELGLVDDFKLTPLGTQMFSSYVNGNQDEVIDLVLTLF